MDVCKLVYLTEIFQVHVVCLESFSESVHFMRLRYAGSKKQNWYEDRRILRKNHKLLRVRRMTKISNLFHLPDADPAVALRFANAATCFDDDRPNSMCPPNH